MFLQIAQMILTYIMLEKATNLSQYIKENCMKLLFFDVPVRNLLKVSK